MLVSKGLLNTKVYLCRQSFTLPYILGFVTYFMAVIFSVFLWQLTAVQNCECLAPEPDPDDFHIANPGSAVLCVWTRGSPVLVEFAVGIPIVILIGARFFVRWVENDYEVMPSWNNRKLRNGAGSSDEDNEDSDDEDDEDGANGSQKKARANPQADGGKPKFGLGTGTFTLPPLKKSTLGGGVVSIKMPALPVRSPWAKPSGINKKNDADSVESNSAAIKLMGLTGGISNAAATSPATAYERDHGIKPLSVKTHPGAKAFFMGHLATRDYGTLLNGLVFLVSIFILCTIIASTEEPGYAGHVIWVGLWVIFLTVCPLIKYFNHFKWSWDIFLSIGSGYLLLIVAASVHFSTALKGDVNSVWSLMNLLICLYWPALLAFGWAIKKWQLVGFMDVPRSAKIIFGICAPMYVLLVFVIYVWIDVMLGAVFTLLTAIIVGGGLLVRDWARNGYYVSRKYSLIATASLTTSSIFFIFVGFTFDVPIVFFVSVGFFCIILKQVSIVIGWWIRRPPFSPLYVSPFVFPIFMYNPDNSSMTEENGVGVAAYSTIGIGMLWGIFCIIFINPLGLGVMITCLSLVAFIVLTMNLIALTPRNLGEASQCVDDSTLQFSSKEARREFKRLRSRITFRSAKWEAIAEEQERAQAILDKYAIRKRMKEEKPEAEGRMSASMASKMLRKLFNKLHREYDGDDMFTFKMALMDAIVTGRGPLAFLFAFGYCFKGSVEARLKVNQKMEEMKAKIDTAKKAKAAERKRKKGDSDDGSSDGESGSDDDAGTGDGDANSSEENPKNKEIDEEEDEEAKLMRELEDDDADEHTALLIDHSDSENEEASVINPEDVSDSSEIFDALHGLVKADSALDTEYAAEMRMVIHFQLLTIVSAKSRVEKESVEFQMFLRENRFKLMANGVKPPASIFRSNSYANIDMKLVANWLIRLTPEQHERFNQLRDRFSAEMEERETIQDMEDAQLRADEETYLQMREQQDWQRGQLYLRDVQARQAARAAAGTELPAGVSLDVAIAREKLEEIAAGKLGKLKPGHFGRDQQWSDPEFPAIRKSLGNCAGAQLVKKWKEARAINIDSDMFKGGTDPDDVHQVGTTTPSLFRLNETAQFRSLSQYSSITFLYSPTLSCLHC